ncbi:hypothetical protein ABTD85_20930, partial [Acinetobacter baumannii]
SLKSRLGLVVTGGARYTKHWQQHEIETNVLAEINKIQGSSFGFTGYGLNAQLPNTPAGISQGTPDNNFIPVISGQTTPNNLLLSQIVL